MRTMKLLLLVSLIMLGRSYSFAAVSPVGLSIMPPVQFPWEDANIIGFRVSALWGKHRSLYGLDVGGIGNITNQNFVGLGVAGIFNTTHGATTIILLQAAGVANISTEKINVFGVQVAGFVNSNKATSSIFGLQVAAANISPATSIYGFQVGAFNKAHDVYGFQIGIVNYTNSLHGIQIGLVNINETGFFRISPILNIGF